MGWKSKWLCGFQVHTVLPNHSLTPYCSHNLERNFFEKNVAKKILTLSKFSFVSSITFAWHKQSPASKSRTVDTSTIFQQNLQMNWRSDVTSRDTRKERKEICNRPRFAAKRISIQTRLEEWWRAEIAHGGLLWSCLLRILDWNLKLL